MHVNVQIRHNAQTGEKAPYYRLKEFYRDVHGHVHSLIVFNIGFEPNLTVKNVQRIALALTERFKNCLLTEANAAETVRKWIGKIRKETEQEASM